MLKARPRFYYVHPPIQTSRGPQANLLLQTSGPVKSLYYFSLRSPSIFLIFNLRQCRSSATNTSFSVSIYMYIYIHTHAQIHICIYMYLYPAGSKNISRIRNRSEHSCFSFVNRDLSRFFSSILMTLGPPRSIQASIVHAAEPTGFEHLPRLTISWRTWKDGSKSTSKHGPVCHTGSSRLKLIFCDAQKSRVNGMQLNSLHTSHSYTGTL